ncbi:MAG: Fur family transcriptional regulator [Nitrospirota bacterium]
MPKSSIIFDLLKSKGFRLTRARKTLIRIFVCSKNPLAAADLNSRLEKMDVSVNKTTIYREIDFLKGQRIIRELQFGDGKRRYEIWPDNHHHHIVCINCDYIECVELDGCLEDEEKKILRENNFKTIKHSLEFQGLCAKCQ